MRCILLMVIISMMTLLFQKLVLEINVEIIEVNKRWLKTAKSVKDGILVQLDFEVERQPIIPIQAWNQITVGILIMNLQYGAMLIVGSCAGLNIVNH